MELPPYRQKRAPEQAEAALAAAVVSEPVPGFDLTGRNVLVIDDQNDVRDYIAAVLRRSGANVRSAASVREAVTSVEESTPDLVLCDIAMPHEDGFAFMHWIRESDARSGVPVLAITAFGRENDEERVRAAGFEGYIRKPVEPEDLVCAVAKACRPAGSGSDEL